ncbi:hypothetical protein M426DRAFT_324386 [Hypoxylon sp. CI-4A]|nr:hypothetical protein M426DRAFT_324386 [Hypoxylon sp. CI-4A]
MWLGCLSHLLSQLASATLPLSFPPQFHLVLLVKLEDSQFCQTLFELNARLPLNNLYFHPSCIRVTTKPPQLR